LTAGKLNYAPSAAEENEMPSGDPITKIQAHFQTLSTEAKSLNAASDELTKVVGVLDDALRKLNVGITVWAEVSTWREEVPLYITDGMTRYGSTEIGYCKVNGKWGIALRRLEGDDMSGDTDIDGPWLFHDAPRDLRLSGVDKLPEVIERLGIEAAATAKEIQQKTKKVQELSDAIFQISNEPIGVDLAASFAAAKVGVVGVGDTSQTALTKLTLLQRRAAEHRAKAVPLSDLMRAVEPVDNKGIRKDRGK
jgi:hypothetical protein